VDPGPFFYIHITVYFLQALFTFLQTNIFYHMIHLILYLQQTGEIENLTASWGKVLWLCYVQVPHCCWCKSYAPDKAPYINCLEPSPSQLASTFGSCFFLLLVRLNLGFILRETCRCAHHTFLLGLPTGWLAPPISKQDRRGQVSCHMGVGLEAL
jgi:hypothetical protein